MREFLREHPVYLSIAEPPSDLPALGVPTTLILDTHGAAMVRDRGAANWDDDSVRAYIQSLVKLDGEFCQSPPLKSWQSTRIAAMRTGARRNTVDRAETRVSLGLLPQP